MITQAAIQDTNGKIWTMPQPKRHSDIVVNMIADNVVTKDSTYGFLDENGKFYTREEAYQHVLICKQQLWNFDPIDPKKRFKNKEPLPPTGIVFSEELW